MKRRDFMQEWLESDLHKDDQSVLLADGSYWYLPTGQTVLPTGLFLSKQRVLAPWQTIVTSGQEFDPPDVSRINIRRARTISGLARATNWTWARIGKRFNISRCRAWQISGQYRRKVLCWRNYQSIRGENWLVINLTPARGDTLFIRNGTSTVNA